MVQVLAEPANMGTSRGGLRFALLSPALTFAFAPCCQLLAHLMETFDESVVRRIDVGLSVRYRAKKLSVIPNAVKSFDHLCHLGACLDLGSA